MMDPSADPTTDPTTDPAPRLCHVGSAPSARRPSFLLRRSSACVPPAPGSARRPPAIQWSRLRLGLVASRCPRRAIRGSVAHTYSLSLPPGPPRSLKSAQRLGCPRQRSAATSAQPRRPSLQPPLGRGRSGTSRHGTPRARTSRTRAGRARAFSLRAIGTRRRGRNGGAHGNGRAGLHILGPRRRWPPRGTTWPRRRCRSPRRRSIRRRCKARGVLGVLGVLGVRWDGQGLMLLLS